MSLCNVTGTLYLPDGSKAYRYIIYLQSAEKGVVADYLGSVIPAQVQTFSTSDGSVDFSILSGVYRGVARSVNGVYGRDYQFTFTVPDAPSAKFEDCIADATTSPQVPGWLQQALAYKNDAEAAAAAATAAAEGAATDAANLVGPALAESIRAEVAADADRAEAIQPRIDEAMRRSAPLMPGGAEVSDYPYSVSDASGNQMMGYHSGKRRVDFGFPVAFGDGSGQLTGGPTKYLFSVEDESGYPVFALDMDGNIVGNTDGGQATASTTDTKGFAAKRAADEVPVLDDDEQAQVRVYTTDREALIGTPFRGAVYASGAAGAGVNVGLLPMHADIVIELRHDNAYIYSLTGFAGTGHNTIIRTPGTYTALRVCKGAGGIIYQVIKGGVTESTVSRIRNRSVALAGQSHMQIGYNQGVISGLLDGLAGVSYRSGNWITAPTYWTPHPISGATGSSAISSISRPENCWWNHATNQPDSAMLTFMGRVQAAVTAGQPVPEDVLWAQGEGDTSAMSTGLTSLADHWSDLSAAFTHMRSWLISLGATDPRFYIAMLGRGESADLRSRTRGFSAVRQNYLRLIAETPWVHYGCEMYDLPGTVDDIHYGFLGYYTLGYRLSRAVSNVRTGTNYSLGPTATVVRDGGRSIRITISGSPLHMPSVPDDVWIIPAGGDATSNPIPCERVAVEGNQLVVTATADVTGCRVLYPYDMLQKPRGDSIVYALGSRHVKMAGLPLCSFISDPLT